MCLGITAARHYSDLPDPLTFTAHYLSKVTEGVTAKLQVHVLNKARTSTNLSVHLYQEDKLKCVFTGVFGVLNPPEPQLPTYCSTTSGEAQ